MGGVLLKMLNKINGNKIVSIIFMLITFFVFFDSFSYPEQSTIYVRFVLIVFFVLLVILFFTEPKEKKRLDQLLTSNTIKTLISLICFLISIQILGFLISAFIFAVVFMSLFNKQGFVKYTIISGICTGIIFLVFKVMLNIWFPVGILLQ